MPPPGNYLGEFTSKLKPGEGVQLMKNAHAQVHGKVSKPTVITPFMRGAIIEPRLLRKLVTRSVVTDLMWT